ncbi:chromosome partitioning protein ParB, partial [Salmonella enterica subsp. enterica serovar Java]|nr:chromosome partitioning protein ParB [Salmonella enterica subsp. enterica serovar Java]
NEAGLTGAARDAEKMKKGDAAELAEDKMRGNRWVPVWMCAPDAQNSDSDAPDTVTDAENAGSDADIRNNQPDAA